MSKTFSSSFLGRFKFFGNLASVKHLTQLLFTTLINSDLSNEFRVTKPKPRGTQFLAALAALVYTYIGNGLTE